jgi:hypothetical protein
MWYKMPLQDMLYTVEPAAECLQKGTAVYSLTTVKSNRA